jgi:hypothetical protein
MAEEANKRAEAITHATASAAFRVRITSARQPQGPRPPFGNPASRRRARSGTALRSRSQMASRSRRSRLDARRQSQRPRRRCKGHVTLGKALFEALAEDLHHVLPVVAVPVARLEPAPLDIGIEHTFDRLEVAPAPRLHPLACNLGRRAAHGVQGTPVTRNISGERPAVARQLDSPGRLGPGEEQRRPRRATPTRFSGEQSIAAT